MKTASDRGLSVIVIAHNAERVLPECLASLLPLQDGDEIILVDNGSCDRTTEMISSFAPTGPRVIRHLSPTNTGISKGRATGASLASNEVLVFVDVDLVLAPGVVSHVREKMAECDGIVGAYVNAGPGLVWYRELKHRILSGKVVGGQDWRISLRRFTTMSGGLCAIRSEAYGAVGGYNREFPNAALEDIDLELRLLASGCQLDFCGAFSGIHHTRLTLPAFVRWCWRAGSGNARVFAAACSGVYRLPATRYYPRFPAGPLCWALIATAMRPLWMAAIIECALVGWFVWPFLTDRESGAVRRLTAAALYVVDETITLAAFLFQCIAILRPTSRSQFGGRSP